MSKRPFDVTRLMGGYDRTVRQRMAIDAETRWLGECRKARAEGKPLPPKPVNPYADRTGIDPIVRKRHG